MATRKDALLEGWKTFWVEEAPEGGIPGVVEVERVTPARLVSSSPRKTEEALLAQAVRVVRSGPLEVSPPGLEEILSHLVRRSKEGRSGHSRVEGAHGVRAGRGA